jgi:hypothetical protein
VFVTYRPEDQPAEAVQRWEFDPGRIRSVEAELIEKRYGQKFDVWRNDVRVGSAKARRVLLWHLLRRQHPVLRYEDTPDFLMDEVLVEHSVAELVELRDRMAKATLDEETRTQISTALDLEITEAMAREGLVDVAEAEGGKATSPAAESATG